MTVKTLQGLTRHHPERILFRTVAGSRAYGTAHAHSDQDLRGVYLVPTSDLLSLETPPPQVADARNDVVYYTLARFLELALKANPNILELLFMPADCVQHRTPYWDQVLAERDLFVTRLAYASHVGYARAQIRKARGRNKWVNRPQPEIPPGREDFCWLLPRPDAPDRPFRPRPLKASGVDLAACHAAALEHSTELYRLYHYGSGAKGVFRDGNLVCESIPPADEGRCIGLLLYNQAGYRSALADHRNYWEWRRQRNERRWRSQEQGTMDYDAKNMAHTFRLLLSGEHILREGRPLVRFSGERLALLKDILAGRHPYDELMRLAEEKLAGLERLHAASHLPERPDPRRAGALLRRITRQWEHDHA